MVEPTSSPLSSLPSSSLSSEERTEDSHLDLNENEGMPINENVHEIMKDVSDLEGGINDNLAFTKEEYRTMKGTVETRVTKRDGYHAFQRPVREEMNRADG